MRINQRQSVFVYLLISIAVIFTYSCSEQLELAPTSSIGVENMWQNSEQAEAGATAMYHNLRSWVASQQFYILGSGRSQEHGWTYANNPSWKIKYWENNITAENFDINWQTPYNIIGLANQVIDKVPEVEGFGTRPELDRYLGEAHAVRAYVYFILAKTWGDVPLETEPIEGYDPETTFKERTSVDEIFDLIKEDIERALELLPDNGFSSNRARWSVPAVNTLKGDVHLWTGKLLGGGNDDIQSALAALQNVQASNVSLLDEFLDVFSFDNKGNEEVIFAVHFNRDEWGNHHYIRMWGSVSAYEDAGEDYVERYTPAPTGGFWVGASTHLVEEFIENDDPRGEGKSFVVLPNTIGNHGGNWPIPKKYRGTIVEGQRRFIDDIILYRYADVLLLIAEAKNALGQDPTPEVNEVRERAYGDDYEVLIHGMENRTQEENDEIILQERYFELAFESKLWWDFVRFDKAYEEIPTLQGRTDVPLLFPVESQTMVRNSRITQTPGY